MNGEFIPNIGTIDFGKQVFLKLENKNNKSTEELEILAIYKRITEIASFAPNMSAQLVTGLKGILDNLNEIERARVEGDDSRVREIENLNKALLELIKSPLELAEAGQINDTSSFEVSFLLEKRLGELLKKYQSLVRDVEELIIDMQDRPTLKPPVEKLLEEINLAIGEFPQQKYTNLVDKLSEFKKTFEGLKHRGKK